MSVDKIDDLDILDGLMDDLALDMDAASDPNHVATCAKCRTSVLKSDISGACVVRQRTWHNQCFTCEECDAGLRDTGYFVHPDTNVLQCQKCHVKAVSPKCDKCEDYITDRTFEYAGKKYHESCFTCSTCNEMLCEKKFYPNAEKNTRVCEPCFVENYRDKCEDCKKPIISDKKGFTFSRIKERKWHNDCFICEDDECQELLDPNGVLTHEDKVFCATHHGKHTRQKKMPAVENGETEATGKNKTVEPSVEATQTC